MTRALAAAALIGCALLAGFTVNAASTPAATARSCSGPPRPAQANDQVNADIDGDGHAEPVLVHHSETQWFLWSKTSGAGTVTGLIGPTNSPSSIFLNAPLRFGATRRAIVPTVQATLSNTNTVRFERLEGCRLSPLSFARGSRSEETLPFGGGAFTGWGVQCIPATSLVVLDKVAVHRGRAHVTTWKYRVSSQRTVMLSTTTKQYPVSNRLLGKYEGLRCRPPAG